MTNPSWTICIATNPWRCKELERLMGVLQPQVDKYKGKIEVLIFFNNFEYSLGYLRQCLIEEAKGEYVSHIDDDDMVPEDFCDTIMPLLDGVDYIGFQVDFYDKGVKMKPVYHSLKYSTWYEDETGYYRGVTHLNPLRRELALEAGFPTQYNIGEDAEWARRVIAKTEHVIDKPMYIYWHEAKNSVAYTLAGKEITSEIGEHAYITRPHDTPLRPKFNSKNIKLHTRSTKDAKSNN